MHLECWYNLAVLMEECDREVARLFCFMTEVASLRQIEHLGFGSPGREECRTRSEFWLPERAGLSDITWSTGSKSEGNWVRGVDIKMPEYEASSADEFEVLDLRRFDNCLIATRNIDQVYNLAADMGGIGYITAFLAQISVNNTLINAHMLEASRINSVKRFLFSSSACVYAQYKQKSADVTPLREEDAFPADPEPGYGWEKLWSEELCRYFMKDYGMETRVVRFHNVYGPLGTYDGGKEKSPAAISRKVALAKNGGEIEVWGDGEQTRSYMYIDDCVEGLIRLMASNCADALNFGTDQSGQHQRTGRPGLQRCRQTIAQAPRPDKTARRPRPQQRQFPPSQRTRLGTLHQPGTRPGHHLSLDRIRTKKTLPSPTRSHQRVNHVQAPQGRCRALCRGRL